MSKHNRSEKTSNTESEFLHQSQGDITLVVSTATKQVSKIKQVKDQDEMTDRNIQEFA